MTKTATALLIHQAIGDGRRNLSEYESKRLLAAYGIPVVAEALADGPDQALAKAASIGYPVVLKFCAPQIAHKTEKGLVELDLRNAEDLSEALQRITGRVNGASGDFLVQAMVRDTRELSLGMVRDPNFGPCVMFGLGGILSEVLKDVVFRVAPVTMADTLEMMNEIRGHRILEAVRGMPPADLTALGRSLMALGAIGLEHPAIKEIDVNPMILQDGRPVAVDALVVLEDRPGIRHPQPQGDRLPDRVPLKSP